MAVQKLGRGLFDRIAKLIDFRVDDRTRGLADRVNNLEHATADHRRRLDNAEHHLEQARGDLRWTRAELDRLIPHVAAQEGRLETLRESISLVPNTDTPQVAEARTLIEEIQRQHAQIRVRLAGISRYEDRLRRLEERTEQPVPQ
jgi:chromosome segregation ATPase